MNSLNEKAKVIMNFLAPRDKLPAITNLIFALGSYDYYLAVKVAKIYRLYQGRVSEVKIIVTGGIGKFLKKPPGTEADFLKGILLKKGVPEKKILIEDKSTNTQENILLGQKVLKEQGIDLERLNEVVIISTPLCQRRSGLFLVKYFPKVRCINCAPYTLDLDSFQDNWLNTFLVFISIEFKKVITNFPELAVPKEISEAYSYIQQYLDSNPFLPILSNEEIFALFSNPMVMEPFVVH